LCTLCMNSRVSAPADETTQLAAQPPSTPGRPVAKRDRGIYVTLKWTQPDDDGGTDITGYVIKYRGRPRYRHREDDDELTDDDKCSIVNVAGNTTQFQFTDELEKLTRYQFAVAAVNAAGQGQFSLFSHDVDTGRGEHCCDEHVVVLCCVLVVSYRDTNTFVSS